jgi:hypothetical protein
MITGKRQLVMLYAPETRAITWETIFLDEGVCVGPLINCSGRSGDDGDANFHG